MESKQERQKKIAEDFINWVFSNFDMDREKYEKFKKDFEEGKITPENIDDYEY